ncbi:MAG: FG-GAP repeat domain-containing protein [Planctomycetota bacterium]
MGNRLTLHVTVCASIATMLAAQAAPRFAEVHRLLPQTRVQPWTVFVADVDGDGRDDLVAPGVVRSAVLRSRGDNSFVELPAALAQTGATYTLGAHGDVDGDGDSDLLLVREASCSTFSSGCSGGQIAIFRSSGVAGFQTSATLVPIDPSAVAASLSLGDVDGDGDLDLVVACRRHVYFVSQFPGLPSTAFYERGENLLFLNDGTGAFAAAPANLPLDRNDTNRLVLGDFDSDGDADLIALNLQQDAFYRNDGTGVFVNMTAMLPLDARADAAGEAFDLDGDGDRDLVSHDGQSLRVLRNDGSAFVDVSAALPAILAPIRSLIVGDFDGSGSHDVAVGAGDQIVQLRNDGAGVLSPVPTTAHWSAVSLDTDGDGDQDLVRWANGVEDYELHRNDGAGNWVIVARDLPQSVANMFGGGAVDLDLDGDLDVVATGESAPNSVYINDGAGHFEQRSYGAFTSGPSGSIQAAIADLDGDLLPEVVVARWSATGSGSQVYSNTGATLDAAAAFGFAANAVAVGDLDGDGDLDLYFACSQADRVMLNQGGLSFVELPGAVLDTTRSWVAALSDVDDDGDLDAVVAGLLSDPTRILLNDGSGSFSLSVGAVAIRTGSSQHIVAADFDADGDEDVVVAIDGQPNHYFRNNGAGVFADSSGDLPVDNERSLYFGVADYDGDGDLDLLECAFASQTPGRLLLNDGAGVFAASPGALPNVPRLAHEYLPGDYDRDGDVDAFLLVQGSPVLLQNLRNQLSWASLPRVGSPIELALRGAAGTPYALAATAQRVSVQAPFGVLHVDLNSLLLIEAGAFDAAGEDLRSYPVPNVPALAGLEIHWQAVMFAPLLLGNLETTELLFR